MNKLISVIIPCYNQAQFLPEALQSVLEQTYTNWECIIVNDGSPDNIHEIAQEWLRKDNRFKYIQKENGGLSSARNAGLDLAIGEFIQFLDSDDLIEKEKFKESINSFNQDCNLDVVITDYNTIYDLKTQKFPPHYNLVDIDFNFETILNKWDIVFAIPIHCALFKTFSIKNLKFNEELKAKEDWLFWIQFFQNAPKIKFINQQLVSYRKHQRSMTQSASYMKNSQDLVINFIKQKVTTIEYEDFLLTRLNYYKEKYLENSLKNSNLKNSLTFRVAQRLKKIIDKLGLLPIIKTTLQKLRK